MPLGSSGEILGGLEDLLAPADSGRADPTTHSAICHFLQVLQSDLQFDSRIVILGMSFTSVQPSSGIHTNAGVALSFRQALALVLRLLS